MARWTSGTKVDPEQREQVTRRRTKSRTQTTSWTSVQKTRLNKSLSKVGRQLETEEAMSENAQEMVAEIEEQAAEFAVSKGYD